MAEILHRVSIAAAPGEVHDLIATTEGIERWWTGRNVDGGTAVGERLALYFSRGDSPSAVMEVVGDTPEEIAWRCVDGPEDWRETRITFTLKPSPDGSTTLLFEHAGWREANEFMAGCSTNWGAYLASLKSGAEGDGFAAYPEGEVSRW
ncbi:MAG TPA: SRPBCC domain-containing protein [Solirubrobacteraceae bacterium]|nr:SRPBCC domain-containing protein [Solirubrobacteraceae bacterium]